MLGVRQDDPKKQGTTVTKKYQTTTIDTNSLAVPEQVSVAMGEIAADMQEGLLALAVGTGLQVMGALNAAGLSDIVLVTDTGGPRMDG